MMHHKIKIKEPYYMQVIHKKKPFEIRFNDRDYQVGDTVEMYVDGRDWPEIEGTIGYVTSFMQKEGYVVFSLLNLKYQVMKADQYDY